jgi:hypothetical protein
MDNEKMKSRRGFLSLGFGSTSKKEQDDPMVKMLTADGTLVEVKRSVLESISQKKPSSNQEIFDWMNNPSKEQTQ